MNTEQNYVGKQDSATTSTQPLTPEQRAIIPNGKPKLANSQPEINLDKEYQDLYRLISDFLNYGGARSPVELLNELMLSYLHDAVGFDPNSEGGPHEKYSISVANLDRILNVTQLTNFLVQLSERWQHIARLRNQSINE